MTFKDLLIYFDFKQVNIARALGLKRNSVSLWKKRGKIPYARQCEIEIATKGELKAQKDD